MKHYFLAACVFVSTSAFATDSFEMTSELVGNSCEVTNDNGFTVVVTQVKFTYSCLDGIIRRAPLRLEDILPDGETNSYRFPGPEGGCINYFVHSCKAMGTLQGDDVKG